MFRSSEEVEVPYTEIVRQICTGYAFKVVKTSKGEIRIICTENVYGGNHYTLLTIHEPEKGEIVRSHQLSRNYPFSVRSASIEYFEKHDIMILGSRRGINLVKSLDDNHLERKEIKFPEAVNLYNITSIKIKVVSDSEFLVHTFEVDEPELGDNPFSEPDKSHLLLLSCENGIHQELNHQEYKLTELCGLINKKIVCVHEVKWGDSLVYMATKNEVFEIFWKPTNEEEKEKEENSENSSLFYELPSKNLHIKDISSFYYPETEKMILVILASEMFSFHFETEPSTKLILLHHTERRRRQQQQQVQPLRIIDIDPQYLSNPYSFLIIDNDKNPSMLISSPHGSMIHLQPHLESSFSFSSLKRCHRDGFVDMQLLPSKNDDKTYFIGRAKNSFWGDSSEILLMKFGFKKRPKCPILIKNHFYHHHLGNLEERPQKIMQDFDIIKVSNIPKKSKLVDDWLLFQSGDQDSQSILIATYHQNSIRILDSPFARFQKLSTLNPFENFKTEPPRVEVWKLFGFDEEEEISPHNPSSFIDLSSEVKKKDLCAISMIKYISNLQRLFLYHQDGTVSFFKFAGEGSEDYLEIVQKFESPQNCSLVFSSKQMFHLEYLDMVLLPIISFQSSQTTHFFRRQERQENNQVYSRRIPVPLVEIYTYDGSSKNKEISVNVIERIIEESDYSHFELSLIEPSKISAFRIHVIGTFREETERNRDLSLHISYIDLQEMKFHIQSRLDFGDPMKKITQFRSVRRKHDYDQELFIFGSKSGKSLHVYLYNSKKHELRHIHSVLSPKDLLSSGSNFTILNQIRNPVLIIRGSLRLYYVDLKGLFTLPSLVKDEIEQPKLSKELFELKELVELKNHQKYPDTEIRSSTSGSNHKKESVVEFVGKRDYLFVRNIPLIIYEFENVGKSEEKDEFTLMDEIERIEFIKFYVLRTINFGYQISFTSLNSGKKSVIQVFKSFCV